MTTDLVDYRRAIAQRHGMEILQLEPKPWPNAEQFDDKGRLKPVKAVDPTWHNNPRMMSHVARLGFAGGPDDWWCDLTWGRGVWWKHHAPGLLTPFSGNFLECPYPDGIFAGTAIDPPYVSTGGRETSNMQDFLARYGLKDVPKDPLELQGLMNLGLQQAVRITEPGGRVLMKCMDYISSGNLQRGSHWTRIEADRLGLHEECWFGLPGNARAQPLGRRQVHPRNNFSFLFVFRTPK